MVETQLDDLTIGSWQQIDHFPEQNKQLSFLGEGLGIHGRSSLALKLILAPVDPFPMEVPGRVGDDAMHPGASPEHAHKPISPIGSAGSLPSRSTVPQEESPGSNERKTRSANVPNGSVDSGSNRGIQWGE